MHLYFKTNNMRYPNKHLLKPNYTRNIYKNVRDNIQTTYNYCLFWGPIPNCGHAILVKRFILNAPLL